MRIRRGQAEIIRTDRAKNNFTTHGLRYSSRGGLQYCRFRSGAIYYRSNGERISRVAWEASNKVMLTRILYGYVLCRSV